MKFKIDENLPLVIKDIFLKYNQDCHSEFDENIQGVHDEVLLNMANNEERILVTLDLDFANITNYPPQNHNGVIILRPIHQDIKTISNLVTKLIAHLGAESIKNKLWIVENNRIRIRDGST